MTDKPVSHKRPVNRASRVALKHLAKPESQLAPRKASLRPLSDPEKAEVLHRAGKGQTCRQIASEMGIPFVLVQRLLSRTTTVIGELELIHFFVENGKQAASLQIAGIRFVVPAKTYARPDFLPTFTFLEHTKLELQVEWNGENFVVLDAKLCAGGAS